MGNAPPHTFGARAARAGAAAALALGTLAAAVSLTSPSASAAAGDVSTVAGSAVPAGPAASTGMIPVSAAAEATTVLVADSAYRVVRRVDPQTGTQVIVAGKGESGDTGDGGPATAARFKSPVAAAPDGAGGLYVVDAAAHKVRHVDAGGTIATVAGTGTAGYTGDTGAATAARLAFPRGVASDGAGGFYVADAGNHVVRRVDAGGTITTTAGAGTAGNSGNGGAATAAQLDAPVAVALSGGDLFVADQASATLRKVHAGTITQVAAAPDLLAPSGLTQTATGVLVVDRDSSRVLDVTAAGAVTVVAGTGTAAFSGDGGAPLAATFAGPLGVAAVGGTVYIADTGNGRVRSIGATVATVAGNGTGASGNGGLARAAQLASPRGLAADAAGSVYVADASAAQVRRISPAGVIASFAGTGSPGSSGDGGPATAALLTSPVAVAVDGAGRVFISDSAANKVRRVDTSGLIATVAGTGANGSGGDGGAATAAQLSRPAGLAFDPSGRLLIADYGNNKVRRVDVGGTITTVAGSGTSGFTGNGGAATAAQLAGPEGVAVAADGTIYVADSTNDRVRKISTGGTIDAFAGSGIFPNDPSQVGDGGPATAAFLLGPRHVAVDADGSVLIADAGNARVRRVDPSGTITTVLGSTSSGYAGDGGAATSATLTFPVGIVRKAGGDLLVSDSATRHVRRVAAGGSVSAPPSAVFTRSPDHGDTPLAVSVDASASSDPEAQPLTFAWDFGDGAIATGVSAVHTYTMPGTYTITLAATDPGGETGIATAAVAVTTPNVPPTAGLVVTPASGRAPLATTLDASSSVDPDGGALTYTFDPGDGATPVTQAGATLAHTYATPGTYTARVTVTDPRSATATAQAGVTAAGPQPPIAVGTAIPSSGQAPLAVAFDASASNDPDGTVAAYHWAFGDGGQATTATANHTYTTAGDYTATLTVTDDEALTDTATFAIHVSAQPPPNQPPIAHFTATPTSGDAPLDVAFDASSSSDPDGSIVSYWWDFGDGTQGGGAVVSHRYTNPGGYRATLAVTDDDGAVSAYDLIISANTPDVTGDQALVQITNTATGANLLTASGVVVGDISVNRDATGGVVGVRGSGTLPGGAQISVNIGSLRFFGRVLFNVGNFTVADPATGRTYPTVVLAKVASPGPQAAESTNTWVSTNKSPWVTYSLHWIVLDGG